MRQRRIFIATAVLLLIFTLALPLVSCGETAKKEPTVGALRLVTALVSTGKTPALTRTCGYGTGDFSMQFGSLFDIPESLITDGAVAYSPDLCAEEVTVLVAKDTASVETVRSALETHRRRNHENYVKYDAVEADKLENALVFTYGRYCFLLVAPDPDAVKEELDRLLCAEDSIPVIAQPDTETESETETETESVTEGKTEPDTYDYSSPVPESEKMNLEAWESGTVLIGDSRLYGLVYYCGLEPYANYAVESLGVSHVFSKELVPSAKGKVTIYDALATTPDFSRCYLLFGINEFSQALSTGNSFYRTYANVISRVREVNPDAEIYVLSLYPVEEEKITENKALFTNENVRAVNLRLAALAESEKVYFIDCYTPLSDGNRGLPAGSTNDGFHVGKGLCRTLLDTLLCHIAP